MPFSKSNCLKINNLGLQNRFLCFDEMEIGKPKVKDCWPWHVPNFKELRLVPLILGRIICFQLQSKMVVLQGLKHILLIEVENKWFQPMKVGPTSKPNSLKLGTCEGQHSFTFGLPNSIPKTAFLNMCGLPFKHHESLALGLCNFCPQDINVGSWMLCRRALIIKANLTWTMFHSQTYSNLKCM